MYPAGTIRSSASNLNVTRRPDHPQPGGRARGRREGQLYNHDGAVDLIADVTGYFTSSDEGATHINPGPKRLMDTREGLGVPKAKVGGRRRSPSRWRASKAIPATGVTAVVLNVTATNPTARATCRCTQRHHPLQRLEPELHRRPDDPEPGGRARGRREGQLLQQPGTRRPDRRHHRLLLRQHRRHAHQHRSEAADGHP